MKSLSSEQKPLSFEPTSNWKNRLPQFGRWLGLGLLVFGVVGWFLTFPVLGVLVDSLSGNAPLTSPGTRQPGPVTLFRNYPQLIWLSLAVGSLLLWGWRPFSGRLTPLASDQPENQPALDETGRKLTWPGLLVKLWPGLGIAGLALVLFLATSSRIGDSRAIGGTDLIHLDYDESVHAGAALLMAQGKTVYRDFFLTHAPVGPLLWSIPLRLGGAEWGGLNDLLRMRLFTSILSLFTITLAYLIGRKLGGPWVGPVAGSVAALVLALDGGAIRTDQQMMLEPLINLFTAGAIWAFVQIEPHKRPGLLWPLLAGSLAGVALAIKVPALAVVVGLGLSLLIWRQWRAFGVYAGGVIGAYLVLNGPFMLSAGSLFFKQVFFYQLLRPVNKVAVAGEFQSNTDLTAFSYIGQNPSLALTTLLAGLGLVAIVLRWGWRREGGQWLPVVLVTILTCWLYTGKAGFFPHYYAHMALPLALLGGGVVNFWRPQWWKGRVGGGLAVAGAVVLGLLTLPALLHAGDEPSKPTWSWERAADRTLTQLRPGSTSSSGVAPPTLATLDPRYSFVIGTKLPRDSFNRFLVDNAGYTEYLALGLEGQSLSGLVGKTLFNNNYTRQDLRDFRYTPLVQENTLKYFQSADYVLVEEGAKTQLMDETFVRLRHDFITRAIATPYSLLSNGLSEIKQASGALFGEGLRLVGYDSPVTFNRQGAAARLPLTLFWRAESKISQDYVIFVHLLDEAGETVAQRDTAPRNGQFDTSKWEPGELLDDDQALPLPANLLAGRYRLQIGVYNPSDGVRLSLAEPPGDGSAATGDDSLILLEVTIN